MTIATPSFLHSMSRILKASFAGAKDYSDDLKQATGQLTISIGQSIHEGEKLVATIKLVTRSFGACKIMIDDSIQWHTLAILGNKASKQILIQEAIEAGDHYLKRYQSIFNTLFTIPYEIIRWKDWLYRSDWEKALASMRAIYQEDEMIRTAIHQNVHSFLSRYERRGVSEHYVREYAENLCTEYLLEECAVMKDLWIKLGCHYEVYPSGRNEAMKATYERYIQPSYPHLLKPIALRFHRRGNC